MVEATAGCVWGWLRPSRVDVSAAGQAGCLAKAGAAARRRAGATIQACTVVAPTIRSVFLCELLLQRRECAMLQRLDRALGLVEDLRDVGVREVEDELQGQDL